MGQIAFSTIESFSEKCLNAAKPEDITKPFSDLLRNEGILSWYVGSLAFVSSDRARGFGFFSMPEGWFDRYREAGHFEHDAVFQHALRTRTKVTWAECRRQAIENGASARSLSVFKEAAKFELTDGLIMPVRGFGDLPGAVTLGGLDPDLSRDAQSTLYTVGAFAYEGLRRLVDNVKPIPPFLTEQELEVLQWTVEGKSATDIAAIMDLSPHTVREYHCRIKEKYRVGSLIQAGVLAVLDGTIHPSADRWQYI
jgi:LuxR family transcriptional regulator